MNPNLIPRGQRHGTWYGGAGYGVTFACDDPSCPRCYTRYERVKAFIQRNGAGRWDFTAGCLSGGLSITSAIMMFRSLGLSYTSAIEGVLIAAIGGAIVVMNALYITRRWL